MPRFLLLIFILLFTQTVNAQNRIAVLLNDKGGTPYTLSILQRIYRSRQSHAEHKLPLQLIQPTFL